MAIPRNSTDGPPRRPFVLGLDDSVHRKRHPSLFGQTPGTVLSDRVPDYPADNDLRARAFAIRAARRRRGILLPPAIFGEPAWDALLELFIARGHQRLSLTRLADSTKVPVTTMSRWLQHLSDQGVVFNTKSPTDARENFVDLTAKGLAAMTNLLQGMPTVPE